MIKLTNVTKKYGDFYAVRDISFTIEDNQIVGLLGSNGAGKTTTMNMITGFIDPTNGIIEVNGLDISKKPRNVKSLIGYMPEGVPLYSDLTVKEFVSYMADLKLISKKDKKNEVNKVIEETGLKDVQNKLTRNLSRGYKQRTSLAGALVGNPKILILDEPTVGLDPKQVIEIRQLIKDLGKNHTVILSSHILSEVSQICEKVIIIDKGEIVAIDTPNSLENKTKEQQEIILTTENNCNLDVIKEKISEISKIEIISENEEEKTKTYKIIIDSNLDFRKQISFECAKQNIAILEIRKNQNSLEDAFIKLTSNRKEYTQEEIKQIELKRKIDEVNKKKEIKKQEREKKKLENKKKEENKNDSNN